jgi:hypothetical protein
MSIRFNLVLTCAALFLPATSAVSADKPVELTLTPRVVEKPLLKHRLLPAEFELQDGNAAPVLLRMIWDQKPYISSIYGTGKVDDALKLRLDDPQLLKNGTLQFDGFYRYLKQAARVRGVNWEYPLSGETPAAYILLPDVQGGREMVGKGLAVWIRYHIAKGELDAAREGIGVGLAASRHYSRTPFIIIQLVCRQIDDLMLDRVEELIAQAECPNLYWSLAAVPQPMHERRPAVEFEERVLERSLVGLDGLESTKTGDPAILRKFRKDEFDHLDDPRSQEDWEGLFRAILFLYADIAEPEPLDEEATRQLRQRTIATARKELSSELPDGSKRVQQMSDAEAAVRWFAARHRALSQEITATMSLSPKAALPKLKKLQAKIDALRKEQRLETVLILTVPLKYYVVLRRNERRIAMLRVVEGLRHYAATHDGKLPEKLGDLTDTPAPHDPLLEKPFAYTLEEGVATLSAEGIEVGEKKLAAYSYRIQVRKP